MPPAGQAPWINIITSTFADDLKTMLDDEKHTDVEVRSKIVKNKRTSQMELNLFLRFSVSCGRKNCSRTPDNAELSFYSFSENIWP